LVPRNTSHESNGERIAPRCFARNPIQFASFFVVQNDHAADAIGMTVQILGRRVDHDVHTKLERPLQVWRHESVVANDARAGAMRDLADLFQIRHDHHGLVGVSRNTIFVFGLIAASTFSGSEVST
jgi:hypothetical protein